MTKKTYIGLFALTVFSLFWVKTAFAQHETKTADGLRVTFATASVEEIKKHPEQHPEIKMHGGPKGTHHILIHLESEKTEKPVSNVSVSVTVHNPDGTRTGKALEPMTIGGVTDFGNYFDLKEIGNYHVDVSITPEKGRVSTVSFVYERRPGH